MHRTLILLLAILACATAADDTATLASSQDALLGAQIASFGKTTWVNREQAPVTTGRILVVEAWATWCGPCRESIPMLGAIQANNADRVTVIGVTSEDRDTVQPFVALMKPDYAIAIDPALYSAIIGSENRVPTAVVTDATGTILYRGHPAKLGIVLPEIVSGTWSVTKSRRLNATEHALEQAMAAARAGIQGQDGVRDGAIDDIERAALGVLAVVPGHPFAMRIALGARQHRGDRQAYRKLVVDIPDASVTTALVITIGNDLLADQDIAYRQPDQALRLAQAAWKRNPADVTARKAYATVLAGIGRPALARQVIGDLTLDGSIGDAGLRDYMSTMAAAQAYADAVGK